MDSKQPLRQTILLFIQASIFFGGIYFLQINFRSSLFHLTTYVPHLYWLGILFFSFTYGSLSGIFMGGISGVFSIDFDILLRTYGWDAFEILFLPLLYIFGGGIGGVLYDYKKGRFFAYKHVADELGSKIVELEKDREHLIKVNLSLEKQVVSRESSIVKLHQTAQQLSSLNPIKIVQKLPDLIFRYLNANSCSIYLLQHQKLILITKKGWTSDDQHPLEYHNQAGLYLLIHQKMRLLYPTDLESVDHSILVAPLISKEQNQILGMIKIEQMEFKELNQSTIHLFQILTDWITKALENSIDFQKLTYKEDATHQTVEHILESISCIT